MPDKRVTAMDADERTIHPIDILLVDVLRQFPQIRLAMLFGSMALGHQRQDSDVDIAVSASQELTVNEKTAIISALAERTGRSIDLVDLSVAAEPLLGQIVRYGRRILGGDRFYGNLISRHLLEQADFMPYRSRLLAERRQAWIGK